MSTFLFVSVATASFFSGSAAFAAFADSSFPSIIRLISSKLSTIASLNLITSLGSKPQTMNLISSPKVLYGAMYFGSSFFPSPLLASFVKSLKAGLTIMASINGMLRLVVQRVSVISVVNASSLKMSGTSPSSSASLYRQ